MPKLKAPKRERFCHEYLIDLEPNDTQAAIRDGYSKKTAYSQGNRLLKFVEVKKRISELGKEREKRVAKKEAKLAKKADETIEEINLLAHSDIANYLDNDNFDIKKLRDIPAGPRRAISSIKISESILSTAGTEDKKGEDTVLKRTVELKQWDKTRALDMEAKHKGLLNETVDVNLNASDEFMDLVSRASKNDL